MKSPVIVVVDSNAVHRNLLNYNLAVNKFLNVHTFLSQDECLYRLKKNFIPDFIITDLEPNDPKRFDFLFRIREISPTTSVICFTEIDDPEIVAGSQEAGAVDYILKTNKPDSGISELLKNIRFLAREKQGAD
ncbi:MAG: response regulator [Bacteroidota bacterium]